MARYAAFLRGVMPMNCKMPALKAAFEAAGFTDVKTVLASGNVVFDARRSAEETLHDVRSGRAPWRADSMKDGEIFSCYPPTPKGRVFMTLIEKSRSLKVFTR